MPDTMVFKKPPAARDDLKSAIDAHYRADESDCIKR